MLATSIKIISNAITVDVVMIGDETSSVLRAISWNSGGYCFKPETLTDALRLNEMETFLSFRERKPRQTHLPTRLVDLEDHYDED